MAGGGPRTRRARGTWRAAAGMEATLRIANEKRAYCLVDRATWLAHRKEIDALVILVEGDARLFNPYSVIVVSPAKFPWLNVKLASRFADFIRSPEGQAIIRDFGKDKLRQRPLFPRCRALMTRRAKMPWATSWTDCNRALALLLPPGREILQIVVLSLAVSGAATVLAALAAIPAALFLALKEFRGKRLLVGLVNTAMAVPAVLIGLLVYGLVSRRGPLGALGLLFTPGGHGPGPGAAGFSAHHRPGAGGAEGRGPRGPRPGPVAGRRPPPAGRRPSSVRDASPS